MFVLLLGGLINASSLSLAENIENDVVSINEVKKDVNNYDNASVQTETAISTEENVETTNTDVTDNGSNVVMTNAENDNKSAFNTDDKVIIAKYEVNKANDKKETQIVEKNAKNAGAVTNVSSKQVKILGTNGENDIGDYHAGVDLYFSTSQSAFSTITGVDSYKVGNRVYTFGINANFSWRLKSDLHMFAGLGVKYDWFNKYSLLLPYFSYSSLKSFIWALFTPLKENFLIIKFVLLFFWDKLRSLSVLYL